LAALKSSESELQQTLSPVEQLSRQAQAVAAQIDDLPKTSGARGSKERKHGSAPARPKQPALPVIEQTVRVQQQKYAYKCGGCIETAPPGPERATSGARYSLDFGIKVAVDKHLDHIRSPARSASGSPPGELLDEAEKRHWRTRWNGLLVPRN
jgi:hypothetical protein